MIQTTLPLPEPAIQAFRDRWLILALIAYLWVHWLDQWSRSTVLDWKKASDLALSVLFPAVL